MRHEDDFGKLGKIFQSKQFLLQKIKDLNNYAFRKQRQQQLQLLLLTLQNYNKIEIIFKIEAEC
jgi:hypothetical protein